ncbi:hypothetical protein ABZP36_026466 [Zizania latifolia]
MGRSPCCEKEHTNKGAWTKQEDERLVAGIDPVTHRPVNAAAPISFQPQPPPPPAKEQTNKTPRCPDLNLDLCISPPCQEEEEDEADVKPAKRAPELQRHALCFGCSLGLQKECKCSSNFLGLTAGMLDFRSLEMK